MYGSTLHVLLTTFDIVSAICNCPEMYRKQKFESRRIYESVQQEHSNNSNSNSSTGRNTIIAPFSVGKTHTLTTSTEIAIKSPFFVWLTMTLGLVVYNAIESRNTRVAITKRTRDKIIVTRPTPIRLIRNNLFIIQFCCSMTAQAASLETVIWFMVVAVTNLMHSQCHI